MSHRGLVRARFLILAVLLALSVSGWTERPLAARAGPTEGAWTGITSRGYPVSFTVTPAGTQWSSFSLTTDFDFGFCSGKLIEALGGPGPVTNDQFGSTGEHFAFTGQFTAQHTARGTYSFTDYWTHCCAFLNQSGTWTAQALVIPIFDDVPASYWAHDLIEQIYTVGITGGCGTNPLRYCPEGVVTRAQMAVFLLRGIHGSTYAPPDVGGSTGFGDVAPTYWSAAFIKQLAAEGITTGCGNDQYCPEIPVNRAQMAVFLLRSRHGAGYTPPAVGSGTGFGDVPADHWAAPFIKQLVTEGITAGCGNGNYCPDVLVTRAQMAVFLVKTFDLP